MSFESHLTRLEEIVEELDGDEVALERALALFEEGIARLRSATAELGRLEEKVKVLSEEAEGTFALEDLDP
jgi:exodeoxyribonuclease VII small subunit